MKVKLTNTKGRPVHYLGVTLQPGESTEINIDKLNKSQRYFKVEVLNEPKPKKYSKKQKTKRRVIENDSTIMES